MFLYFFLVSFFMVRWNLEDIYPKEETEQRINDYTKLVDNFISQKKELTKDISPKKFLDLVKQYEQITLEAHILSQRPGLQSVEDITNPQFRKEEQEMDSFFTEQGNKLIYFMHFFKDLPDEKAKEIISEAGKYEYFLKSKRKAKPHTRTTEEEKIINLKDLSGESGLSAIRDIVVGNLTFEFQGKKYNESELSPFCLSEKEEERKEAFTSLLGVYKDNKEILGEVYKNIALDWANETTKIRSYKTPISARNFSNDLPDEVVDTVLDVITEKRTIFQDFFKLKSELLGIENNRDNIYAPYILKDKKEYSYEEAKKITYSVFEEFSSEAFSLAKNIFEKDHVHSEVLPNKMGGAFCSSYGKDKIPYVMLNHMGKLEDVSTMCHEIGHGVHGQLAKDKTEFTFHSSIALAEVASIFSELLLKEKMMKTASEEEKKYLLIKELDGNFASILRQAYFVKFEMEAHEKVQKGVTVDELTNTYYSLLKEQFGDTKVDEKYSYEWLRIPHIYNSPFYCYSYSFANLTVLALYNQFKIEGKESFVPKYLNILKSGGDADVVDIMGKAGFDITKRDFWEGAFNEIEKTVDELKDLI